MAYTDKTWSETVGALAVTFEKWGVDEWTIDPLKPRFAGAKAYQSPDELTVTLSYTKDGVDVELTIDKWPRAVDNLRALYLTVESLRLNEYRGIADAVRRAYAQLPAPKVERDAYEVLGVHPRASIELIEDVYKTLARRKHPDAGGTREQWDELQAAIERIRKEKAR